MKALLDVHAFDLSRKLEADPDFLDELKTRHHHDIVSFSFELDRPVVIEKFEEFVADISEKEKVYRSKGFLWLQGNPRRAIFHGVNNRFTLMWDRLWEKQEKRSSQIVFIGKGLDESRLRQQIEGCLS
jgi:G3E family GTPase